MSLRRQATVEHCQLGAPQLPRFEHLGEASTAVGWIFRLLCHRGRSPCPVVLAAGFGGLPVSCSPPLSALLEAPIAVSLWLRLSTELQRCRRRCGPLRVAVLASIVGDACSVVAAGPLPQPFAPPSFPCRAELEEIISLSLPRDSRRLGLTFPSSRSLPASSQGNLSISLWAMEMLLLVLTVSSSLLCSL